MYVPVRSGIGDQTFHVVRISIQHPTTEWTGNFDSLIGTNLQKTSDKEIQHPKI